jgi:hypothetical protein
MSKRETGSAKCMIRRVQKRMSVGIGTYVDNRGSTDCVIASMAQLGPVGAWAGWLVACSRAPAPALPPLPH